MSYGTDFAKYYDIFYGQKEYKKECQFLDAVIRKNYSENVSGLSILELACGTGTHAFNLGGLGYNIVATDVSEQMLAKAREKTKSLPNIRVERMDMGEFKTFGKAFDVVLCLFDSLGYLLSNDAIVTALQNVKNSMNPNGIFIFEFWNAGAMLRSFDPVREKLFQVDGKSVKRISETRLDYMDQCAEVKYSLFEQDSLGNDTLISTEIHRNRFFLIQEMNALLHQAGLTCERFFSGFSFDGMPDENTWHVVAACKHSKR